MVAVVVVEDEKVEGKRVISGETMFALDGGESAEASHGESRRSSVGSRVGTARRGCGDFVFLGNGLTDRPGGEDVVGRGISDSTGSGRVGFGAIRFSRANIWLSTRSNIFPKSTYRCAVFGGGSKSYISIFFSNRLAYFTF